MVTDVLFGTEGSRWSDLLAARLAAFGNVAIIPEPTLALVEYEPAGPYPASLRVYGKNHLRVKIVQRQAANSTAAEIRAEEAIDESLVQVWKEIYWPGMVRGSECIRPEWERLERCKATIQAMRSRILGAANA